MMRSVFLWVFVSGVCAAGEGWRPSVVADAVRFDYLGETSGKRKVQGNSVPQLREGRTYHVTLTKEEARVRFEVRGPGVQKVRESFISWRDPGGTQPVWGSGKFAFRQIGYEEGVVGAYDNVRVVALTRE